MSDHDGWIHDLIARRFGLDPAAMTREAMNEGWAPVERWRLRSDRHDVPGTVVVKTRRTGGSGWGYDPQNLVDERRALQLLAPTGLVPHVFAADDEAGVIVMEDIVGAVTVERVLFGDDPAAADACLVRLATAFGAMHAATTAPFADPIPRNPHSLLTTLPPDAWSTVILAVRRLGLTEPGPDATATEIEALATALSDMDWWALTHADATPSNVLVTTDRIALIDFEGAALRHIAMDGGAFALGFPAYRYWADLSPARIAAMTVAWRTAIAPGFPAVADDAVFFRMLATGSLAWTILRLTRLPLIADDRQPPDQTRRRRTQILQTIVLATETCRIGTCYPAIAGWLDTLGASLRQRWPEATTPRRYPAFNDGSREGWTLFHDL